MRMAQHSRRGGHARGSFINRIMLFAANSFLAMASVTFIFLAFVAG